jgi:Fe2+ or Zn2+ uptake regulation protein
MISKLLLDKGLYANRARITVLKIIVEHNGLTANSIYVEANKERELKIGTIYRVLYDLEKI